MKRAPEWQGMLFPDVYVTKFFFHFGLAGNPGRVLELGCGNGNNARLFAEYGWQVTGVDLDPTGLEAARANWSEESPETGLFLEHDLREGLPALPDLYNALVANGSLYYFERHFLESLLDDTRGVLAPGAAVYFKFRTPNDWRYGQGAEVEKDTFRISATQTREEGATMAFYEPNDLVALIEKHLGPLTKTQVLLESHQNPRHGLIIDNHDVIVWGRVA